MDQLRSKLRGDTGRLAATYLAIIMGLTIVFSGVIFAITSSQFDRPLPRGSAGQFRGVENEYLQTMFERRAQEARSELFISLLLLNLTVLLGGSAFSYFLARKSLQPIEAAMQSQARFVSDASHELRTPLTALQVTNEVALRKKKLTLADAKELIGQNVTEILKLHTITESLLRLARQDTTDLSVQQVSAQDLVTKIITTITPLSDKKNMAISSEVHDDTITANQQAVAQIMSVLVDNAVKYGPEDSTITLSSARVTNAYQFSVHDDGRGIPVQYHQKIFTRFYRIDESRSSQNTQGTGLGLSIAKAIADRHGYIISLQAGEREGNTFILSIPANNP